MSLRPALSVAIASAIFVSQMILHTEAQSGVAAKAQHITFDCDPEQLHGAAKLICLAKRFEEGRRLFDEETFQGNGRTCVTCHSVKNGTFSPEDARRRLATNPRRSPVRGRRSRRRRARHVTDHRARDRPHRDPSPPARQARGRSGGDERHLASGYADDPQYAVAATRLHVRRPREHARRPGARGRSRARPERCRADAAPASAHRGVPADIAALLLVAAALPLRPRRAAAPASERCHGLGEARAGDVRQRAHHPGLDQGPLRHVPQRADARRVQRVQYLPADPGLAVLRRVSVSERNKLNLPTHEFIVDGTDTIVTPDPGHCLTDPLDPDEFPPELFGPGGPFPLIIACNLFKTPSALGDQAHGAVFPRQLVEDARRGGGTIHVHVQE